MQEGIDAKYRKIAESWAKKLKEGTFPPWKVEEALAERSHVPLEERFAVAAMCRRLFIEEVTGQAFSFIQIPEKPYKTFYFCPRDNLTWELDGRDNNRRCSLCEGELHFKGGQAPLVANYVGGSEIYFSYAGCIDVVGDVEKRFTNLLVYGTGMGPIGVTRGCFLLNKLGGAFVRVSETGQAVRCNGYMFSSPEPRQQARAIIEKNLNELEEAMNARLLEFSGRISAVDFDEVQKNEDFILYVDFVAEFENFRGHGDISRAVGFAKDKIESLLDTARIPFKLSVIAQGHDGDLKPSPNNKRGRYASAEIHVPVPEFEALLKVDLKKFMDFVKVDAYGAENLGCQFYSGMGGEIIPAVYKATQVNPQSPLVSSFQNISCRIEKNEVVYSVELPNVEVGIASTREGLISPVGREALRIMGIKTAREFCASLAAQVLAGEFNLALEISRERLYSS